APPSCRPWRASARVCSCRNGGSAPTPAGRRRARTRKPRLRLRPRAMINGVPMMSCRRSMAVLVWILAAMAMYSRPASAQGTEIFGGYSFLVDPDNSVLAVTARDNVFPIGWIAGAACPVWKSLSIAVEAAGYYKARSTFDQDLTLSFHSAMAGPRGSVRIGAISEFIQVLSGAAFGRAS